MDDNCLKSTNDEDLKKEIIYEGIIEYSYSEFEIFEKDVNILHRNAFTNEAKNIIIRLVMKLKKNTDFYGEVLLD
jgi:hypothetical protein